MKGFIEVNQKNMLRAKEGYLKAPFNIFTKNGLTTVVHKERMLSNTEMIILETIRRHSLQRTPKTMWGIAKALNVSSATVYRSLRNLVNAGLVVESKTR